MSIWAGYPASYTPGRARPIQFVTLHYTAGNEGPLSAEGGVAYDQRRGDGTSCHYFTDSQGPALQEVPDGDRSHTALYHGNEIGLHIEICGTIQSRAQWLDPVSLATLTTTAELVRDLCDRHGLEKRRLSVAETRAAYYGKTKPAGINDHYSCTLAFPEDGGDHTDVGPEFPWDVFMEMVAGETTPEEDDMRCFYITCDDGTLWLSNWSQVWQVGNWPGDEAVGHRQFRRELPGSTDGTVEGFLCNVDGTRYIESRGNLVSGLYGVYVNPASGGGAGGGLTMDQAKQAAFEGAQRAERE